MRLLVFVTTTGSILKPIAAGIRQEAGYFLDWWLGLHRAKTEISHTFILAANLDSSVTLTCISWDYGRELEYILFYVKEV